MKKKDIFYETRRNITLISTSIVFLCLFVFVVIFQALYISNTFNEIDKDIMRQKMILEKEILKRTQIDIYKIDEFVQHKPEIVQRLKPNVIGILYKNKSPIAITPNAYFDLSEIKSFNIDKQNEIVSIKSKGYNFRGIRFTEKQLQIEILMNIDTQINSVKGVKNAIYISLVVLLIVAMILSKILANKVIQPVKEAYNKQVFFVQDASHEMRTPLAIIKGKLELLIRDIGNKDESNFEDISKIMSEIRGLEKLNNDLLLLSKVDTHSSIKITEFKLSKLIEDIQEFYTDLAELQNKSFSVIYHLKDTTVYWDYDKVKRCIVILLENAFKYTKEDGKVELVIEEDSKNIIVKVVDNGIGIKEEDQSRIFDRFFRSNDIRATDIAGSGIGLSLLSSIADNLDIKIKLVSRYNEGSQFTLLIPKRIK